MVAPYDAIAPLYDAIHDTDEARREDAELFQWIDFRGGHVLDIGCGTGLFLDMTPFDAAFQSVYTGIDPSAKMVERLYQKHPTVGGWKHRDVLVTRFEEFLTARRFDLIVALYGAASYLTPGCLQRVPTLLRPGGRLFLMFYAPGYHPVTYTKSGVHVLHRPGDVKDIRVDASLHHWNNYIVAEWMRP